MLIRSGIVCLDSGAEEGIIVSPPQCAGNLVQYGPVWLQGKAFHDAPDKKVQGIA